MNEFLKHVGNHNFANSFEKLLASIIGIAILYLLRLLVMQVIKKNLQKELTLMRWKKGISTGFYVLSVLLVALIWINGFQSFATIIALIAAGLAIAFKEPLLNIGAWAYILARRPFIIGDRIEIDGHAGEVLDIRMFMFTLQEVGGKNIGADQPSGRIIHVPNGRVFITSCYNFTESTSFIYHEIQTLLTHDSNWEKLETFFLDFMEQNKAIWKAPQKVKADNDFREYYLFDADAPPKAFVEVKELGVLLTMRFTVNPRGIRKAEDQLWRAILPFIQSQNDIHFALNPTRLILPTSYINNKTSN